MIDLHGSIQQMHSKRADELIINELTEAQKFELNHKIGDLYLLRNRNKTTEICKIAYFPLDTQEPTALIEITQEGFNDFREVPIRFLSKIT